MASTLLAVAFLAGACTSTPASNVARLPGAGGSTTPAGSGAAGTAQSDRDFVAFTKCMRAHGVATRDPYQRPGHVGLTLTLPTRDATTETAYTACDHFLARTLKAKGKGAVTAPLPAARLAALGRYAACMRAHSISMPDPTPAGELNLGPVAGITGTYGRYSPQFRAADEACRHLLPAGVHDDGTGP